MFICSELPEPLLTFALYSDFIHAGCVSDASTQRSIVHRLAMRLPVDRRALLHMLLAHWHRRAFLAALIPFSLHPNECRLAENSAINRMSASNLAVCVAPTLLWSPASGTAIAAPGNLYEHARALVQTVTIMIENVHTVGHRQPNCAKVNYTMTCRFFSHRHHRSLRVHRSARR